MKPIGIVIPWFGRNLKGGAETHAWQIASCLAAREHDVEVLTTRCRSHQDDWATNHLPTGLTREPEGFSIRRFTVKRRNRKAFDRVAAHLQGLPKTTLKPSVSPLSKADEAIFSHELIKSPALLEYLEYNADNYHAFLFIPYLYGPILNGLPLVSKKAWLQPCLHDEAYAYLQPVARIFHQARGILFLSEGELKLALQLYGPGIFPKSIVVGGGVEVPELLKPAEQQPHLPIIGDEPYVLCLGRKEHGKNSHLLLEAFRKYKNRHPESRLKLVYAGIGEIDVSDLQGQVFDLGVISESDKLVLLDGCRALFHPSENESFARVIMEAWRRGRPVAVHRDCLATATAVNHCGGGWLAAGIDDWSTLCGTVENTTETELSAKGAAGQAYARVTVDWQNVMDRYEAALFAPDGSATTPNIRVSSERTRAVHQILPNLAFGDAISNSARWIRRTLQVEGFVSEIFVRYIDSAVAGECYPFAQGCIAADDVIVYHHSIGSELTPCVVAHTGPKCLIYHNITPSEFYEPYRPELAKLLRQGRDELRLLARSFPISAGDSEYNARELCEAGFVTPSVLPICVDPSQWDFPPDAKLMNQLQRSQTNLLFVGRLAPSKKQDDLLRNFQAYLHFDPTAVLHLIGAGSPDDPYVKRLRLLVASLELTERVNFTGQVSEAQLAAYYRTAHLFWSMSEHEGFCVPLVEAMWHDVPVFAYKSSAVTETLGAGGLLFTHKENMSELAAAAWLLTQDAELRTKVVVAQRQRRSFCLPATVAAELKSLIERTIFTKPQEFRHA